jgi:adenylosuccinate synthase
MSVIVIIGGQFGSEGKGKVAHYFAKEAGASVAVRVGGSNSGHTVIDKRGVPLVFRVLPTAAILDNTVCALGAGSYIDVDILFQEVEAANLGSERLWIDPNAYIVTEEHKKQEREWKLGERIASTQTGTGAAIVERVKRLSAKQLAKHDDRLSSFIKPVRSLLRSRLDRREKIVIEGTQGFGLSLLHSPYYPKATSRDTTAASFVAEVGVSPLDVMEVVLVIRAFPIRVAGDSGPLPNQTDWKTITDEGGWKSPLIEFTSVTKKERRVARFDPGIVKDAIEVNAPTSIVLNHLDYIDATCVERGIVTSKIESFVGRVEQQIGAPITHLGLDPRSIIARKQTIRLRA